MHVYLPEKYRSLFLHGVFFFSKVGVLVVNFDGFFALIYSSHLLWFWHLGRTWYHHTFISRVVSSAQHFVFLERESWSQPYYAFFGLPLGLIMPSIQMVFFFRDEAIWKKVWQKVVFMHNFWNFKVIPYTEIILTSIQRKLVLKKIKWFLWRGFQKWWKLFVLILVKNIKWHLVDQKGFRFNLRVLKNQCSKHSFYLDE